MQRVVSCGGSFDSSHVALPELSGNDVEEEDVVPVLDGGTAVPCGREVAELEAKLDMDVAGTIVIEDDGA